MEPRTEVTSPMSAGDQTKATEDWVRFSIYPQLMRPRRRKVTVRARDVGLADAQAATNTATNTLATIIWIFILGTHRTPKPPSN